MNVFDDGWSYKLIAFQTLVANKLKEAGVKSASTQEVGQPFEDNATLELCRKLIEEEAAELSDAIGELDKAHILKEAVDLIYVVIGMCVRYGWALDEAFNRVHENNMLKIKTGTVRPDGKLVKHELHPKVLLKDLV